MTVRLPARAEINVTPLIDVMLVLLILFMLVAPVAPRGLDTVLPDGRAGGGPPAAPVLLEVGGEAFAVDSRPVATLADLEARLRETLAARSDRAVVVRAAGGVAYGRVVEAMDAATGAGASRIGVLGPRTGPAE